MLAKVAELMFIEAIHNDIDHSQLTHRTDSPGFDPQVGAALRLIHGRPSEPWTQACSLAVERAATTKAVSLSVISSTANPAGIKQDRRNLLAMTLILLRNQRYASMQNHQM